MAFSIAAKGYTLTASWVKQEKENWCWAACAENSVMYKRKISKTQRDAVRYIMGKLLNPYPNKTGDIKDIKDAAEYISDYQESYTYIVSQKKYSFLRQKIQEGTITIAVLGYYDGEVRKNGHAVIITGYDDQYNKITYYDPQKGMTHTCYYNAFCTGVYNGGVYEGTVYNYYSVC